MGAGVPRMVGPAVMNDVVRTMFAPKFVDELFKEQEMYSVQSTRKIFDRLAHSSIMRLNTNSMDKVGCRRWIAALPRRSPRNRPTPGLQLFDLMTMGLKRQLVASATPMELMDVTLNHLEAVERLVDAVDVRDLVRAAITRTHQVGAPQPGIWGEFGRREPPALHVTHAPQTYSELSVGQWYLLKQTLCRFFQNRRVKVSLFLSGKTQRNNGVLVIPYWGPVPRGFQPPGTVTCVCTFPYSQPPPPPPPDPRVPAVTTAATAPWPAASALPLPAGTRTILSSPTTQTLFERH